MMVTLRVFLSAWSIIGLTRGVEPQPTVKVAQGFLRGKYEESAILRRKYVAFTSIPYAEPPVGDNRFKEPVPAEPWIGTLDATRNAPLCTQQNSFLPPRTPLVSGSEDCLYLNVFTPKLPDDSTSELFSVIFHIHGGAFMTFSNSECSEKRVLDRDVVFVSVNYRLGSLGFLSTQDATVPGNNGLKDQLLALKWVKNNIAAFGGDPNKITIIGMSAGAVSVHMHVLSSQSRGLFQRAIMESGSCPTAWSLAENPLEYAQSLATLMGCPTSCSKTMVDCLRQRPADHLTMAALELMNRNVSAHIPFGPSIEPPGPTAFLTKYPLDIIAEKGAQDVPMLLSFTTDEGLLLVGDKLSDTNSLELLDMFWNVAAPGILDFNHTVSADKRDAVSTAIKKHYLGDKNIKDDLHKFVKIVTDWLFVAPMIHAAKVHAEQNKSPVYLFEFGYKGTKRSTDHVLPRDIYDGVNHGEQSFYVVSMPELLELHPSDQPMADSLLDTYMSFVQGKPMPENWKTVQQGLPKINLLKVTKPQWSENKLEVYNDYGESKFWESLQIEGYTSPHVLHSEL